MHKTQHLFSDDWLSISNVAYFDLAIHTIRLHLSNIASYFFHRLFLIKVSIAVPYFNHIACLALAWDNNRCLGRVRCCIQCEAMHGSYIFGLAGVWLSLLPVYDRRIKTREQLVCLKKWLSTKCGWRARLDFRNRELCVERCNCIFSST